MKLLPCVFPLLFHSTSSLCFIEKLKQLCVLIGRAEGRVLPLGSIYSGKTQETSVWSDLSRLSHKPSWAKREDALNIDACQTQFYV